jgi:hypothetical protein
MIDVHTHHLTWYGRLYFRWFRLHKGKLPSGRGGRWWTRKCNEQ